MCNIVHQMDDFNAMYCNGTLPDVQCQRVDIFRCRTYSADCRTLLFLVVDSHFFGFSGHLIRLLNCLRTMSRPVKKSDCQDDQWYCK